MRNYRATVAYDGTEYNGFQIQVDHPTIQGELERVLARLTRTPVRIHGAGRTDARVHAHGQVISFQAVWKHPIGELERGLNALLPPDISVREVKPVTDRFHARFTAVSREYLYRLYINPVRIPFMDRYAHQLREPVLWEPLQEATSVLVGEQDFAAFGQPPSGECTVRRVNQAVWESKLLEGVFDQGVSLLAFRIEGNAFLRGMVRRLVGTLVDVGLGRVTAAEFRAILDSCDISRASPPAPPSGLFLWRVGYPVTALLQE